MDDYNDSGAFNQEEYESTSKKIIDGLLEEQRKLIEKVWMKVLNDENMRENAE